MPLPSPLRDEPLEHLFAEEGGGEDESETDTPSTSRRPRVRSPPPSEEEGEDESEEESEEESEDESEDEDAEVHSLACRSCGAELSARAVDVVQLADDKLQLWSTDVPSAAVRAVLEAPHSVPCGCLSCKMECRACRAVVGYHVHRACEGCAASGHNGHHFLLDRDAVDATAVLSGDGVTPLRWSELPLNGSSVARAARVARAGTPPPELTCRICAELLHEPVRPRPCAHDFSLCRGCLTREIAARGSCPFDRRPLTLNDMAPDDVAEQAAEAFLSVAATAVRASGQKRRRARR